MNIDNGEPTAGGLATEERAGTIMRRAREAKGLSLADVATRTRVPQRHLQAIEEGDYGSLPGLTYCAGFARAYARAVDLDEASLVAKVRREVDATGEFASFHEIDEPADPARIPPRALAWTAAVIAVLIIGGYALWRMQLNTVPDQDIAALDAPAPAAAATGSALPQPAPAQVAGPVVLTAVDDVWLRIYDADGNDLLERTLSRGESFTVPADANNPMILTGRADALAVTVGGHPVPPLGTAERTVSDLPISAAALMARKPEAAAAPSPGQSAPAGATAASPSQNGSSTSTPPSRQPAARPAPVRPAAPEQTPASPPPSPSGQQPAPDAPAPAAEPAA